MKVILIDRMQEINTLQKQTINKARYNEEIMQDKMQVIMQEINTLQRTNNEQCKKLCKK